jgi:hypothetical protein
VKHYPFRIVGSDPETGRLVYFGGARALASAENRARSYSKRFANYAPVRALTDVEYQAARQAQR